MTTALVLLAFLPAYLFAGWLVMVMLVIILGPPEDDERAFTFALVLFCWPFILLAYAYMRVVKGTLWLGNFLRGKRGAA